MDDKLQEIIDNNVREIIQKSAQWGMDTPPEYPARVIEIEAIIRRFLREYILQIFLFGR